MGQSERETAKSADAVRPVSETLDDVGYDPAALVTAAQAGNWLTVQEAGHVSRLGELKMTRLVVTGKIRAVKVGTRWRVDPQDLERHMAARVRIRDLDDALTTLASTRADLAEALAELDHLNRYADQLEDMIPEEPDEAAPVIVSFRQRADGRWTMRVLCPDGVERKMLSPIREPIQPEYQQPARTGLSVRTRFRVLARDGYRCRYCGASGSDTTLHIDHIQPVSGGGTDDEDNLVTACRDCNLGKSDLLGAPGPE